MARTRKWDVRTGGQMDGRTGGQMDGRTDVRDGQG